jgi:hypothetical protein
MTFRNPLAWIALATLLVPIAIHLLVRAPARPIVLASLRFVPASPMRALRRRLLDDGVLLALRLAVLALAVAALADPLATPACRRATWNGRLARAVVADPRADAAIIDRVRQQPAAFATHVVRSADAASGLAAALVWLDAAPPARREVVFVGPFTLGTVDDHALRAAPVSVGLRFVRTPAPDVPASMAGATVTTIDAGQRLMARAPQVRWAGEQLVAGPGALTPLSEPAIEPTAHGWKAVPLGVEIIGPAEARPALRAALVAAVAVGVPVPSAGARRPIVVVADPTGEVAGATPDVEEVSSPWMADVADAIARDMALARDLRGVRAVEADAPGAPWRAVLRDVDARVMAAVAASVRQAALVIRVRAPAASAAVAGILRSALDASVDTRPLANAEKVLIADARLAAWTRPPGAVEADALATPQASDRAWLWGAALAALAAESLLRRRRRRVGTAHESKSHDRAA